MASIDVYSIFSTSCSIRLTGLDTEWNGGDRTVKYYISKGGVIEHTLTGTITGAPSVGGYVSTSGLTPSTTYKVSGVVYDSGGAILATLSSVTFTTDASSSGTTVTFESFSVEQTEIGVKEAVVYLYGENLTGGTYYIYANGWEKASGTISANTLNNGVIIEFDNFGTFEISVEVVIGATTLTADWQYVIIVNSDSGIEDPATSITISQTSVGSYRGTLTFFSEEGYVIENGENFILKFYDRISGDVYELEYTGYDTWDEGYAESYYSFDVDSFGTFYFCIEYAVVNGTGAWRKNIDVAFQKPYNLNISNLRTKRYQSRLEFSWDKPEETRVTISRYWVGDENGKRITNPTTTSYAESVAFGQKYTRQFKALYGGYPAEILSWSGISTPPRIVINSVIDTNGVISGTWGLDNELADTYKDKFNTYINLYAKGDTLPISQYESVGATSGTFQFPQVSSGEYEIHASSVIYPGDGEAVWSVIDSGDNGEANNSNYKYVLVKDITVINSLTIDPWSWEAGTGSDRDYAYQALVGNGSTINFKYTVWNALVDKVMEVINADPNESEWFTSSDAGVAYLSYEDTKMSSSDTTMTAERFNALKFNVGARELAPSTGITDKNPGDPVIGQEFITITNCLNEWIGKL